MPVGPTMNIQSLQITTCGSSNARTRPTKKHVASQSRKLSMRKASQSPSNLSELPSVVLIIELSKISTARIYILAHQRLLVRRRETILVASHFVWLFVSHPTRKDTQFKANETGSHRDFDDILPEEEVPQTRCHPDNNVYRQVFNHYTNE